MSQNISHQPHGRQAQNKLNHYQPRPHGRPVRASRKRPCPVCGRKGWPCSFTDSLAFCGEVQSERATKDGRTWIHILRDDGGAHAAPPARRIAPAPEVETPRASHERVHLVYMSLLRKHLTLSKRHVEDGERRSLDLADMIQMGCCSTPSEDFGNYVARALARTISLEGVPGFYRVGDDWRMVRCRAGYFVPYRDAHKHLVGLQYRLDEPLDGGKTKYLWLSSSPDKYRGGASSGTPLHVARPDLLRGASEVVVTEGALKAEVAAKHLNMPFIAGAGVTCFGSDFAARLRRDFPALRVVRLAFDMDWQKKAEVKAALFHLMDELERARFRVDVWGWPSHMGKGIDDYLLAHNSSKRAEVAA